MTFRPASLLLAAALAAAVAPAAVGQTYQTLRPAVPVPNAGQLPAGVVLRPGERLVSTPTTVPSGRVVRTSGTRYPTQFGGSGVVRAGGTAHAPAQTARPATVAPAVGGSDQARAQAEANQMARTGNRGHVGGTIGRFEGVGWAMSGTPTTCTPPRGMRLTADAIARGPGGVYRVRAWR